MAKNSLIMAVVLAVLTAGFPAAGQEFSFTQYTPESEVNPLPSASVRDLHIDSEGYLWMVIFSSGLLRYDGHGTELYTSEDGLVSDSTNGLIEDRFGRIWVAASQGLSASEKPISSYGPGERIKFTQVLNGIELTVGQIEKRASFLLDNRGGIWVATPELIHRYTHDDAGLVSRQDIFVGKPNSQRLGAKAFAQRASGEVWVILTDRRLAVFDKSAKLSRILDTPEPDTCGGLTAIYESSQGRVVVGCSGGQVGVLREISGTLELEVRYQFETAIEMISETSDGSLWVSARGHGVLWMQEGMDEEHPSRLMSSNGLIHDTVLRVMDDREGNVWFGQSGGVSKLKHNFRAFRGYTDGSEVNGVTVLPSPGVQTVRKFSIPEPGSLWLGTEKGVSVRAPDGSFGDPGDSRLMANESIWVQCGDSENRVWLGGSSTMGVVTLPPAKPPKGFQVERRLRFHGREATLSTRQWKGPRTYACLQAKFRGRDEGNEALCFSGQREVECWMDDRWTTFGVSDGITTESNIQALTVDEAGILWLGTEANGIFRSTWPLAELLRRSAQPGAQPSPYSFQAVWNTDKGAPTGDIESLLFDRNRLWVGTDKGLMEIDPDTLETRQQLDVSKGLPDNLACSLYQAPKSGNLWVGTNEGLAEVDLHRGEVLRTVSTADGLVGKEVWWMQSVFADEDDTIYYGSPQGLSVYRPSEHKRNERAPRPIFRGIEFSEDNMGRNELKIEFAALSFTDEKSVRYQTRVVGYRQNEWSPPTALSTVRFMNLPAYFFPRQYRFEVKAANNDGVWSEEPLSYVFNIQPAWWARWYSVLGAAAFFGLLIWLGYRKRTQALHERAAELKKFADALQRAVHNLDEELAERKRVEGELNDVRDKMQVSEEAAAAADERRRLALEELRHAKQTLIQAEKLSSLGQMVASISHEIANPVWLVGSATDELSKIVDEFETFLMALFDDSEAAQRVASRVMAELTAMRANIDNNRTASERLTDITTALRTQSRFDRHAVGGVALNEVVRESMVIVGGKTKRHDIKAAFGQVPAIRCFRSHVGQVVTNLLANAADALAEKIERLSHEGEIFKGKILVMTEQQSMGERDGVMLVVADNGPGVPESDRDHVFEAFFTTKPAGMGTGLGLSVCHTIVQDHEGSISVKRDPELGGARFEVWLPLQGPMDQGAAVVEET